MTVDYSKSCTAPAAGRMDLLCQGLRARHKLTGRRVSEGEKTRFKAEGNAKMT